MAFIASETSISISSVVVIVIDLISCVIPHAFNFPDFLKKKSSTLYNDLQFNIIFFHAKSTENLLVSLGYSDGHFTPLKSTT